jgi:4-amino-4-deoxy-L-arabinose transferase-like glycosyltransferase
MFLVALVARLTVLLRFTDSPHFGVQGGDSQFYHAWALRILDGQWTDHRAFYGLPGYAWLLAGFYALFGVEPFAVIAAQSVVEAVTALLVFGFTRRLAGTAGGPAWGAPAAGAVAALGYICFIPAQAFAAILMPTVWVVAAYWGGLWTILRLREDRTARWWPWPVLGAGIGAFAMMVATIFFLIPLALVAACWREAALSWKQRAAAAALLLAGVFAGCAPAWIHNVFVAREPVLLSAHGGLNFWIGNHPEANGYPKIPAGLRTGQQELLDDSIRLAEEAAGHPLSRPAVSRYWQEKARAAIRADPGRWLRLLGRKLRAFWSAFEYDDLTIIALLRLEGVLWPGISFGVAGVLGLTGLVLAGARSGVGRWIAAAVLLHLVALLPVFVTERYRLIAVPGLLVLGSYALYRLARAAHRRRWPQLAATFALLLAAAVLVFAPGPPQALASMEPYNLAVSELDAAQRLREEMAAQRAISEPSPARQRLLTLAERHLQRAQAHAPDNPRLWLTWGRYWAERGDREKTRRSYQTAIAQDPQFAEPLVNLAVMDMEEQRWEQAVVWLEKAAQIAPADGATFYLLARARLGLNQREPARAAAQKAARLEPRNAVFKSLRDTLQRE